LEGFCYVYWDGFTDVGGTKREGGSILNKKTKTYKGEKKKDQGKGNEKICQSWVGAK